MTKAEAHILKLCLCCGTPGQTYRLRDGRIWDACDACVSGGCNTYCSQNLNGAVLL